MNKECKDTNFEEQRWKQYLPWLIWLHPFLLLSREQNVATYICLVTGIWLFYTNFPSFTFC